MTDRDDFFLPKPPFPRSLLRVMASQVCSRRAALRLGLSGAAAMLLPVACKRPVPPPPMVQAGMYAATAEDLRRVWQDIVATCKADDRGRVHDYLASFILTKAQLSQLIGPALSSRYWARYEAIMHSFANIGAVELVAYLYEHKIDDVVVARVDRLAAAEQGELTAKLVRGLVTPTEIYRVRLKKKADPATTGLRYDGFVYVEGYWKAFLLLSTFFPSPATADGGVQPGPDGGTL